MFFHLRWVLLLVFFAEAHAGYEQSIADAEMVKHGEEIYLQRCQGCHGIKGDGQGPAAIFLDPKPRDFTKGIFKFSSTPNGYLPADQDLMRTLAQGVYGTSMPSFIDLPEMSRFAVIAYLKQFAEVWKKPDMKKAALQGDPFPQEDFLSSSKFIQRASLGRKIFIENCVVCHGQGGQGDGEGAEGLVDDWQFPLRPADLTLPFIKSGKSVRDIYRVLLSGVSGTPMPSFKDVIADKDLWDVTAYVLYLRGQKAGLYANTLPLPIPMIKKEELP